MKEIAGKIAFLTGGASDPPPGFSFTDDERFNAIRRALGEDKAREAIALELISGLVGSATYREA